MPWKIEDIEELKVEGKVLHCSPVCLFAIFVRHLPEKNSLRIEIEIGKKSDLPLNVIVVRRER